MGKYDNKMSGTNCLSSSISFNSNKHITCREGGAFVTNDSEIYEKILSFTRQGIGPEKYIHPCFGLNYRITNLQSAVLFSQLELLSEIIDKKKKLFENYNKLLSELKEYINIQKIDSTTTNSYWLYGIKFLNTKYNYKFIENFFNKNNIEIRPFFYSIDKQS